MIEAALIVSRWLQFAAAAVLCGAPAFALYGLSRDARRLEAAWLKRLLIGAAILGLVAAIVMLLAQSAEMAGDGASAFDPPTVWAVMSDTFFGAVWLVRLALLCLAVLLSLLVQRPNGLAALALNGVALAATLAWIGHGGEGSGVIGGVHRVVDVIHLIAASAWIGALIVLARLLTYGHDCSEALQSLQRFSGIGPLVVAVLIVTGLVNAWALAGTRRLVEALATPYAFVLYLKLTLFAAMLALAAFNRFWLTPRLEAAGSDGAANNALAALRRNVVAETVLAGLVIVAVAVLGVMEPPSAG